MSVGVLGVAGLQLFSMQGNRSAMLGTAAAQLAEDMMDRVRANSGGAGGASIYGGLALGDAPPAPPDCVAGECTAAQMAVWDQAVWKCRLGSFAERSACVDLSGKAGTGHPGAIAADSGLPGGDGAIDVDPASGLVWVTVQWRDGGREHSIALQSRI